MVEGRPIIQGSNLQGMKPLLYTLFQTWFSPMHNQVESFLKKNLRNS
jgi:hypothetical protein